MWGSGLWGVVDWEVIWSDLTCEVHEITTNTGRGGATDRFVPGTATIVASNVNQVSEMIFPRVPETGEGFEFVPQPPIGHEEDLQAPDAGDGRCRTAGGSPTTSNRAAALDLPVGVRHDRHAIRPGRSCGTTATSRRRCTRDSSADEL